MFSVAALTATCTNTQSHRQQSQGTEKAGEGRLLHRAPVSPANVPGQRPLAKLHSSLSQSRQHHPQLPARPVLLPGQLPTEGSCFGTALTWLALWGRLDSPAVLRPGCPSQVSHSLVSKGQAGVLFTCEFSRPEFPLPP